MNTEKTEPNTNRCPKCQAPLPANAPQGLCPKCLLLAASTPTEAGQLAHKNPPPPIEEIAAAFPQLQVLELIGQGGMGVVYKARQPRLDRLVALKLLPLSLAADAAFAERFNREARVLARLNHPNIVTVYDFGQSGGFFYLLMEFVDGVNLRQAMQAGRFTPHQAMMLVPRICEALQFAHDEGILHRDIKPENILLDTKGRVKIADFGIAKLVGAAKENITLTASGQAIGTPHYMAPEQLEHPQDVDQRADIYSLGVVFYEMLTGELPIGRFAAPSTKSTVDPRVDEVVFHALEKEREKRFRSAGEVKTSVEAITAQVPASHGPTVLLPTPGASAAAGAVPPRRVACYFNTPARMRDCFPSAAARIFTCRGELLLDATTLTFTNPWRAAITLPLKDIADLSVGQFQMWSTPWLMKYARINYLCITFRRAGQLQTVHLTPIEPGTSSASQVNDCVARWHEQVQQALRNCGAAAPHVSEPGSVSVSAEPAFNQRVMPLVWALLILGALPWLLPVRSLPQPGLAAYLVAVIGLGAWILWYAGGYLRANSALWHGNLDSVTSEEPPVAEPVGAAGAGSARGGSAGVRPFYVSTLVVMAVAFLAALELCLLSLAQNGRSFPPAGQPGTAKVPAAATQPQFVLYTMPDDPSAPGAPKGPGHMYWHFKCLLPPHQLVRLLLVRWTNGTPTVDNNVSAYFKVGNVSVDEDFYLLADKLRETGLPGGTSITYWGTCFDMGSSSRLPGATVYRELETPTRMTIRSGHQGILRLADCGGAESQSPQTFSGVELRIFLEPITYAPVRLDPFEFEGTNYVAGTGSGWMPDQALKAIKDWPAEPLEKLGPKPAPAQQASAASPRATKAATGPGVAESESEGRFVLYTMPLPYDEAPGVVSRRLRCLLPAQHLVRVLFVRWTNGVPQVHNSLSCYFKVGDAPIDQELDVEGGRTVGAGSPYPTNEIKWAVHLFGPKVSVSGFPEEPAYRARETPAQMTVRSGHQGILHLADFLTPEGQSTQSPSGIELRIFLEPMQYAPVQTDPFEFKGTNFVAGKGPDWLPAQAIKAIKEWPIDK
jgi:tRNA A-37 threonylcarbamoyl transferase component Bud32